MTILNYIMLLSNLLLNPGTAANVIGETVARDFNPSKPYHQPKYKIMLRWAAIFFVIAIIAGIFGFGGVSEGAAGIAKVLFFIFIVGFVLVLLFGASFFKK